MDTLLAGQPAGPRSLAPVVLDAGTTSVAPSALRQVRRRLTARSASVVTVDVTGPVVGESTGPELSISESILVASGWDELVDGPVGTVVVRGSTGPTVVLVRLEDDGHLRDGRPRALVVVNPVTCDLTSADGASLAEFLTGRRGTTTDLVLRTVA